MKRITENESHKEIYCSVPTAFIDRTGIIFYVSAAFCEYVKREKHELLCTSVIKLFKDLKEGENTSPVLNNIRRSLLKNSVWKGQVEIPSVDKEYINVVSTMDRVNGKVDSFVVALYPEKFSNLFFKLKYKEKDEVVKCLDGNTFLLFFQPIIFNKTGEIDRYEALLRLKEKGSVLSPALFLKQMKHSPSYNLLTQYIIQEVAFHITMFHVNISINLSLTDIEKNQNFLLQLFKEKPLVPHYLTIEILEDEIADNNRIKNPKDFFSFLNLIKENGVSLAIDDFGVKHSNWNRFLEFEPDILKIDGSIIRSIKTNKYMIDLLVSLVSFAKKHNISTVAEFVEDKDIYDMVKALGIDYSQGYHLGKPLHASQVFSSAFVRKINSGQ